SVFALYQLGGWFTLLGGGDGFPDAIKTFTNPSQFWDTYFEFQVAAHFPPVPTVSRLSFHPKIQRRRTFKYPHILIQATSERLFVECKQIHVIKSALSSRLLADLREIGDAMDKASWPPEYCLEVEFHAPRREAIESLAVRLIEAALAEASRDSTVFNLA